MGARRARVLRCLVNIGAAGLGIGAGGLGAAWRGLRELRGPLVPQVDLAPPDDPPHPPLSPLSPAPSTSSMGGSGRAARVGELEKMPFLLARRSVKESKVRRL